MKHSHFRTQLVRTAKFSGGFPRPPSSSGMGGGSFMGNFKVNPVYKPQVTASPKSTQLKSAKELAQSQESGSSEEESDDNKDHESCKEMTRILITGANGNIGSKLAQFWRNKYELVLVDRLPPSLRIQNAMIHTRRNHTFKAMDLCKDTHKIKEAMEDCDIVVHLAAYNAYPATSWEESMMNMDINQNVIMSAMELNRESCGEAPLNRLLFASSNHLFGGYLSQGSTFSEAMSKGYDSSALIDVNSEFRIGTKYQCLDDPRSLMDSTPYAASKLQGERLCQYVSHHSGVQTVALRLGWNQVGENTPNTLYLHSPEWSDIGDQYSGARWDIRQMRNEDCVESEAALCWFRKMWLSNIDLLRLFDSAVSFEVSHDDLPFTAVNGMSRNSDMRWCLKNDLGYEPLLDVEEFDPSLLEQAEYKAV